MQLGGLYELTRLNCFRQKRGEIHKVKKGPSPLPPMSSTDTTAETTAARSPLLVQTAKELPQPQVWVALGLVKLNPPPISAVLKSSCIP